MFAEFGQAPLCLELDLDSYEGPWQHVSRFRHGTGWLMVAECSIQSEHDILTGKLIAACDEHENPIPAFQAMHLTECDWINLSYCDELPPECLDDKMCEEEGALIARWHREKNSALAEVFEDQETRVAELEGRVQSEISRNERRIGELRQRRRHPDATPEIRRVIGEIISELDDENDELLAEMAKTRFAIREQAAELEEALWSREDLLIEITPLYVVRWAAKSAVYSDAPKRRKQYATDWRPASGPTGGSDLEVMQLLGSSDEKRNRKNLVTTQISAGDHVPEKGEEPQSIPISQWELRERRLYGKLAKALDKADRLASIIERSHPDDRYLPYNERQHRKALSDIGEIEAEIAELPRLSAADASLDEKQEIAGRSAEEKMTERRERSELDREQSELLAKWVEIAAVRAENSEGSYEAKLAESAFQDLKSSLNENEERRKEIDRHRALEERISREEQSSDAEGEISRAASNVDREPAIRSVAQNFDQSSSYIAPMPKTPVETKAATGQSKCEGNKLSPATVQNALSALSAARKRYYGND